jgi:succinate dehydrogenase / fumarate reductase iron-sulfur subunit
MKSRFDIFRKKAGAVESYRQIFEIDLTPGMSILDVFHTIQERIDPGFSYRYSCRGAICGSCAVRINGTAALACKTQAMPLAKAGTVTIDPLDNMPTVKDLVADHSSFWNAFEKVRPYLLREYDRHDAHYRWSDTLNPSKLDQLRRSIDCIKCAACFSDCPKRTEDSGFIGPAASVQLYKYCFDPRDRLHRERIELAKAKGGVTDCESHGNCVRVCPKDVRPLRAINGIRRDLSSREE